MPPTITVGTKGTLTFLAEQAGKRPEDVTGVQWQPQGQHQTLKFTPPASVEALAVGVAPFKCTATFGPGEKMVYDFVLEVIPAASLGPPKVVPVAVIPDVFPPPAGPEGAR